MGWRGRGRYPGHGPFRDLPPWKRPGWAYGYGKGQSYRSSDPYMCQRFPSLPRWWWSRPEYADEYGVLAPPEPMPEQEKKFLEERAKFLKEEIESIKKRLGELEGKDSSCELRIPMLW